LHPDGHARAALGDQLVRGGRGDDAFVAFTGAGRPIAPAAVDAAVGFDFHLEDLAALGARELVEGQATTRALPLVIGQVDDLLYGGQVGVVAARVSGRAWLLAARSLDLGLGQGLAGGGMVFALGTEELLLTESELGAQGVEFASQLGLA